MPASFHMFSNSPLTSHPIIHRCILSRPTASLLDPMQGVPGGKAHILGGYCIGHSEQNVPITCVLFRSVSEIVIFTLQFQIVDKKEILRAVSNIGIYRSSDKVGRAYLVKYIFENSTVNIDALCNSCEDIACCSSVCILTHYSTILQ
jgi:hypothetical protein